MQTSQKCHGLFRISHYLTLKCHNSVTFQNGHPRGWPLMLMMQAYSAIRSRSTTVFRAILL